MRNYVELQIKSLFFILLYFQKYLNEKKITKNLIQISSVLLKAQFCFTKYMKEQRLIMDGNSGILRSHKVPLL